MTKASLEAGQADALGEFSKLARFVTRTRLDGIPAIVQEEAKRCLLDTIGCIAAGTHDSGAKALLRAEQSLCAPGSAGILGAGNAFSAEAAARVNGYMGDLYEFNDLIGGHASIGTIPAALAQAQASRASGRNLLEATVIGIEVAASVNQAVWDGLKHYAKLYTETGITSPGVPSSIGAAAAAAYLIGLDESQTTHAMAIACAITGWCPSEVIFGKGGSVKPLLFGGWPASIGIRAAHYAAQGMTGPPHLLESDIGYYATIAHRGHPMLKIDDVWRLQSPRRKFHACCGYAHTPSDVLIAMRKEGVPLREAARIVVEIPPYCALGVSKSEPPANASEALFHGQYNMALAAWEVDQILPRHSNASASYLSKPGFASLMKRIEIVSSDVLSHTVQCKVSVIDAHGRTTHSVENHAPKGAASNPMSADEVRDKFRMLAGHSLRNEEIERYIERIESIEQVEECDWITNTFTART